MLFHYQILYIFFYQLVFYKLPQVLYFSFWNWLVIRLIDKSFFFHSKTKVHKFRSIRPVTNQFQKRPGLIERKQVDKNIESNIW